MRTHTHSLPAGVERVSEAHGFRLILPQRKLGALSLVGILPIGVGCLFCGIIVTCMYLVATEVMTNADVSAQWFGVVAMVFLLGVFLMVVYMPIFTGLAIIAGCGEIVVDGKRLIYTERVGPLRKSWWRPLQRITSLRITSDIFPTTRHSTPPLPFRTPVRSAHGAIFVDCKMPHRGAFLLAPGYPSELVEALAHYLAAQLHIDDAAHAERRPFTPKVKVVDGTAPLSADIHDQPSDSKVVVEHAAGGITLTIPPEGVWRGTNGLMFFAVVWNAFVGFFILAMAVSLLTGTATSSNGNSPDPWIIALFMIPFVGAGIGTLLGAMHMGRRVAIIDVHGNVLLITQKGIFGIRQWIWSHKDVRNVMVDVSSISANRKPLMQLQVHLATGRKHGFFTGRELDELRWMATTLRQALGIAESPPD
ncbi:MAG: hypothetical protein JJU36_06940 [Phycisphaeraceae bacterium]|nr:hypothetical protein [Phycisphaeraceae bacterium]